MERRLEVRWWDGSVVGHLVQRGPIFFVYDEAWLATGRNLSPLTLPFTATAFNGAKGIDGLPGVIADCLPDSWGRKIAQKDFAKHKWGEPTVMGLLAWRGTRGVGALQFWPPIADEQRAGDRNLEVISAAALARGAAEIQRGEASTVLPQLALGGTAGGAFPKAIVLAYGDGSLSVGQPDGVGEPCLIKFDLADTPGATAVEHAYARMAASAGIRSVKTSLVDENPRKRQHLLIRRFDIPDLKNPKHRLHFHSLSNLLHKTPGELDYRDFFRAAIRLNTQPGEIHEIARRMVFNVLASNHDDHGKNHAFAYHESGKTWELTPAFDVTFNSGMLERGMLVNGEVWPKVAAMESLCLDAGLTRTAFAEIFDNVSAAITRWTRVARQARVPAMRIQEAAERHRRIREAVR